MPLCEGVHHQAGLQPRHHRSEDGGNRTAGVSSFPWLLREAARKVFFVARPLRGGIRALNFTRKYKKKLESY